jgi:hypothetical protein
MKMRWLLACILVAACLGCQCAASNAAVGSVKPLQNQVWKGMDINALTLLQESQNLFNGETLKINGGGEAQLDFQNQMIIHLYNDSQANLITANPDPNVPVDVRMRLEEGGLVGIVKEGSGKAVFETPGGGTIYITGTRFFIYYEIYAQYLLVGNYDGSAILETARGGTWYEIPKDRYVLYQPGNELIEMVIPDDLDFLTLMKAAADGGMSRTASRLIEAARVTPAEIKIDLVSISPEELYIGDCLNMPDTTFVTVNIFTSDKLDSVWLKWDLYGGGGTSEMPQIQTGTFQGQVGPVSQSGTVYVYVYARDGQGRIAQIGPFTIEVKICIG